MQRLTIKTSTIFIAAGRKTRVYRSVDDIPPGLRRKLEESTTGVNAATILIADRRGREEIVKALRERTPEPRGFSVSSAAASVLCSKWKTAACLALPAVAALVIWFALGR